MYRNTVLAVATLAILLGGCVKKSDYEAVQAQLAECGERADEYEGLYQEAMSRQAVDLEEAMTYFPAAAAELRQELDLRLAEVTESLDESLRADVRDTLDQLTDTMAQGYRTLQSQNTELSGQLSESRRLLESLIDRTGSIETAVGTDRVALLGKRDVVLEKIDDLASQLSNWKYQHVDCNGCPERLRLNKRETDAISQMQIDTVSALEGIRGEFVLMAGELEGALERGEDEEAAAPADGFTKGG